MDRKEVTFEQAEGTEDIPTPLALGELSDEARTYLWHVVYHSLLNCRQNDVYHGGDFLSGSWLSVMRDYHLFKLHNPTDEFSTRWEPHANATKTLILEGDYDAVLGFLQWVLRHQNAPDGLFIEVASALQLSRVAYVLADDPPTIIPSATELEGEAVVSALNDARDQGLVGVGNHLRGAVKCLNAGDFSDCVRESIHAVESAARRLDDDAKSTLGPALKALKNAGSIHPALEGAFSKLYGYTSDEQGVRHSMNDDPDTVGHAEAQFMLVACAGFVSYLMHRGRDAGLLD